MVNPKVGIATPGQLLLAHCEFSQVVSSHSFACCYGGWVGPPSGGPALAMSRWLQPCPVASHELQPHAGVNNHCYESHVMDNITPLVHGTKSTCNITLDEYQHAFYQQSCINIIAPNGSLLQHIGYVVEKDAKHQLREDVHLVSCLLHNIHHDLDLPQQALYGLADLMYRVQEFCDKSVG